MVAGHLHEKNGYYYIILNLTDSAGRRKPKWISTGLTIKGNKKRAEQMLMEERRKYANAKAGDDVLFADFMEQWLEIVKSTVSIPTYSSYVNAVKSIIAPYHMKKAPLNKFERQSGRHPITGVLACESKLREQSWIKFGCNGFERQRPLSQPLAFWLEEDILRYLKMTGIPYAPIYGDIVESRKKNGTPILKTTGVSRSGCMYCMYGVHLEHEPNRFQLMQVTHPQQYDYCINKLGCGAVLDYIGVPYRNQQLEVDHC